jgi:peroxiredoxin
MKMNVMKKWVPLLMVIMISIFTFSCKEEKGWEITINGKVGFPQKGQISIKELRNEGEVVADTIQLKADYTFAKTIRLTEPGYYQLNFYDKQFLTVILDHSNLDITVDGNSPSGFVEVKGSPDQELLNKVQTMMNNVQSSPSIAQLEAEFAKASQMNDQKRITEIQSEYLEILDRGYSQVVAMINDQPPSLGLITLLQQNSLLDRDKYFDVYIKAADKFKKEWPDYKYGKDFVAYVDKMKVTAVGQVAPEIELPNPEGQVIKLSSLRGKYVLIDFWAKWCGPCRRENPNVVMAYNKFKDKGFEVFGVSLDRNKEDWLQAIAEDGLTWTHVSDLKYFESQAAVDYNISAIPFSILLDKEGKIIAKNLRGAALDKKLEQVLGGI